MLINLSNHSSCFWSREQLEEAGHYGEIVDLGFPEIDPFWSELDIQIIGKQYTEKCLGLIADNFENSAVHVMGEMTFSHYIVSRLIDVGITCLASTTKREVAINGALKLSEFQFVRFRKYVT